MEKEMDNRLWLTQCGDYSGEFNGTVPELIAHLTLIYIGDNFKDGEILTQLSIHYDPVRGNLDCVDTNTPDGHIAFRASDKIKYDSPAI